MPDRGIGNHGDDGLEASVLDRGGFGLWHQGDLAGEDEGEVGQHAEAGDGIDRSLQRFFQQRSFGDRFADRLAPGALVGGEFGSVADIAEVALVDLECFGQGYRQRFDVGVARAGVQFDREAWVLAARGGLVAAELCDRNFGAKGNSAQLSAWK